MVSEIRKRLEDSKKALLNLREFLELDSVEKKISNIEKEMSLSGFWERENSKETIERLKKLKKAYESWNQANTRCDEELLLLELVEQENDTASLEEINRTSAEISSQVQLLELASFLSDENDIMGALVSIHPGAGGTESQDWAEMLLRMYLRWIEKRGFEYSVLDYQPGDEAGVKDVTVEVKGQYAYGYLKSESGVHRLVRISPFDANKRRHTSFASLFVYPLLDDTVKVEIRDSDLRIDTFRASGAGGQHVNKTDSAVRITHIPTGMVVQCQSERSQFRNRENAMKVLMGRLYVHYKEEEKKKLERLTSEKKDISWGSQIRSYVFQPYTLVKDHRTGWETSNVQEVMNGEITPFIESYLKRKTSPGKGG
ncbi:MAG: peptide chain release factor 2 [Candidatus Eisenbacteria bacterium]|nr:peptide chain release factor 2 [Candidatus Eisenbacteria bacterium]